MFPKNFANLWKCAILGSFRWQTLLILQIKSSSRIFENVTAKWTFCVQQFFFRPKTISNVAITNTNSAIIAFFLFSSFLPPRSFFFFFPFPSLMWFWSLSSPRNLPFDAFSLNWLQISVGWFSEKSAGYLSKWKTKCLRVVEIWPWIKEPKHG